MNRGARVSASFAFVLAAGCSLIVNTSDRAQCQTTADCEANPSLRGRVCELGFCALKGPSNDPRITDAGPGCVSTEKCTQQNSGRASVCRSAGQTPCTPLEIDGVCPSIVGRWQDPHAILVGALLPLTMKLPGPNKFGDHPYSKRVLRAIELAAKELDAAMPQGVFIGGEWRPIAVLQCDSGGDAETAQKRFEHLTDVAGAEAVITVWEEDVAAIAPLAIQRKTTLVCTDCNYPAPPGTTTWKILPPITADVPLVQWRVAELESQIKAATPGDIRVAVLADAASSPRQFAEEMAKTLVFNGVTAAQNGSTRFLVLKTPDPREDFLDYDGYGQQIADFAPHIVIAAVASDLPKYHVPRIEQKWPAGQPRPYYVVTQLSYDATPYEQANLDDAVLARISGTHPFTSPELAANVQGFETRYRLEYKEPGNGNYGGYDAFYATALAIAANSGQPVLDAARISAGFSSLVSGDTYDLGPGGGLNIALESLAQGKSVDIRGLYTNLDWDLGTREVVSDMGMFCFARQGNGSIEIRNAPGVRWSAATGQVTGTYACP